MGVQLLRLQHGRAVLLLPPPGLEAEPEPKPPLQPADPAARKLAWRASSSCSMLSSSSHAAFSLDELTPSSAAACILPLPLPLRPPPLLPPRLPPPPPTFSATTMSCSCQSAGTSWALNPRTCSRNKSCWCGGHRQPICTMIRSSSWPCTISAPSKPCKQQAFSREVHVAMAAEPRATENGVPGR
jgi:hypothetical protein